MTEPAGRIPEHVLAEIRARLPINALVGRNLRLVRAGQNWKAACPIHGAKSLNLFVYPDHFHCFGCGAHGDIFAWLMRTEGCTFRQAALRCAAEAGVPLDGDPGERRALPPPPPRPPERDDAAAIRHAASIWDLAVPIAEGSPQAIYLAGRGIWPLSEAAHAVLRAALRRYPPDGVGEERVWPAGQKRHPVIVARIAAPGRRLTGVHCIYLAPRGEGVGKLPLDDDHQAKLTFGRHPEGGAIRLAEPAEAMGIAEGIETALAAARLFAPLPVWSALTAGGLEKWVPPKICRHVTIFADRDKPWRRGRVSRPEGTGLHAARVLESRLAERDVAALKRVPLEPAEDYADVLMQRLGVAA